MSKLKDLTGQKFGKLTVIERAENDNRGNVQWLCQCECGNKKVVRGYQLTSNKTKSCGCLVGHVCDEWRNNFVAFSNWAKANGYNDKLTIDRIDNKKGYEPSNCRWVDMKTQQRHRSNNHLVTINGETKCVAEWCSLYPISPSAVWKRTDKGMDIVTAITKPSRIRSKRYDG